MSDAATARGESHRDQLVRALTAYNALDAKYMDLETKALDLIQKGSQLRRAIQRVREVHSDYPCPCVGGQCSECPNARFCKGCAEPAPCPTIRALDAES